MPKRLQQFYYGFLSWVCKKKNTEKTAEWTAHNIGYSQYHTFITFFTFFSILYLIVIGNEPTRMARIIRPYISLVHLASRGGSCRRLLQPPQMRNAPCARPSFAPTLECQLGFHKSTALVSVIQRSAVFKPNTSSRHGLLSAWNGNDLGNKWMTHSMIYDWAITRVLICHGVRSMGGCILVNNSFIA